MRDWIRWTALGGAMAWAAGAGPGPARATSADDQAVLERVNALEQELSVLKRKLEVKDEEAAAKAKDAPIIGAGSDGFFIQSADKKNVLKIRGYVQADSRWYEQGDKSAPTDTFVMRRVRPIVEGTVAEYVDFRIMPDFGDGKTVLQDAYLNLKYFPFAQLQAGKFKAPLGLERLNSATSLMFIERGLPTDLVPNRDLGVQLWGTLGSGLLTYQAAFMNGITDGGSGDSDNNDAKDFVGRVFVQPFLETSITPLQGLGVGLAGSFGNESGAPSSYKTSSQVEFFKYASTVSQDGDRLRVSPQLSYTWGPFGLLAEWVESSTQLRRGSLTETADNQAWQVAGSYVLTGENASFKGVIPRSPFSPDFSGFGAFEVAARFGQLSVDDVVFKRGFANPNTAAKAVSEFTVGVNWYLNRYLKFQVNYDRAQYDGGAARGADRPADDSIFTRFQVQY